MFSRGSRRRAAFLVLVAGVAGWSLAPAAQVEPVYSRGAAGLVQAIERLRTTASAMHTAAHPDDEDTALIARVARGDHARIAYLSLNRGEGGQNIIGLELFDALGVIRTEELLQARRLDGGDQFFSRAFDFGYTKTVEEAAEKWGKERILDDMVRAIRAYRPLVILAGFSGTSADGHGQHQLAGVLTPLAFEAAADPARFPDHLAEGLRPWQPRKLYVRQSFRRDPGNEPTLRLPTGVYDPLLGRSFFEIAMEGRSQHKSQEMGVIEVRGPKTSNMRLAVNRTTSVAASETGIFDGIDTSLGSLAALAGLPPGALAAELARMDRAAASALESPDLLRAPANLVPVLAGGLEAARGARARLASIAADAGARAEAEFLLAIKEAQFSDALVRAAGVVVDHLADREVAAPGDTFRTTVNVFVPDGAPVTIGETALVLPAGWSRSPSEPTSGDGGGENPFARFFREEPTKTTAFSVRVAPDAPFTQPYWLTRPRTGPHFEWDAVPNAVKTLPFAPPDVSARVALAIGGVEVSVQQPLEYRYADPVRGEIRRHFNVVPAVTVAFDEPLTLVPTAARTAPRRVTVRLQSQTLSEGKGVLRLQAPEGWRVEPAEAPFAIGARGEREAVSFTLTPAPGAAPGARLLRVQATVGSQSFATAMRTIDYPHIQKHRLYEPATATARVLDLAVAQVKVGYVMGGGDQVPDAIRRMGLDCTLLTDDQLTAGDLSVYDTIVVGVRASESRPAFVANHGRLLNYAREGGTLIVQYQQTDYAGRGLMPLPAKGNSRVTDETAPVTILQPSHPIFTFPNRIGPADWDGWVQERNLYAFAAFDPQWVPLLETRDPGEEPQRGGQLYTRLGKGHYVYTAYAWFRQLPAGVPGAYRLFANLLSLARAD